VHAHLVAKECLAGAAIDQVCAKLIESLRLLEEGFGVHDLHNIAIIALIRPTRASYAMPFRARPVLGPWARLATEYNRRGWQS
jgi:hypothetical protein